MRPDSGKTESVGKKNIRICSFLLLVILLTACDRSKAADAWTSFAVADDIFALPTGLAADSSGNVYVFDSGNHRVLKLDPAGALLQQWGGEGSAEGQFNCYEDEGTICGLAVDAQDNVYVVDKGNYRIQKFDAAGYFILS